MKWTVFGWAPIVTFSLATIAWALAGRVDTLADHPKEAHYSTAVPYSPKVGVVQSTMGVLTLGLHAGRSMYYGQA